MPPSPYKRNRRMKSRLMAGSDDDRANLREKAVQLMRENDARLGQRRAADAGRSRAKGPDRGPVAHAYVPGRGSGGKASRPHPPRGVPAPVTGPKTAVDPAMPHRVTRPHPRGGDIILKRPDRPAPQTVLQRPDHPAPRTTTGPKANTPLPRPRLKPESGGTGNHAAPQTAVKNDTLDKGARRPVAKRPASAYDNRLSSLARQRALSGNRNNRGTRALMSVATRDTDTGGAAWRASRGYRMGRSIQRRRARRWLRNTAQGPSRPQYT